MGRKVRALEPGRASCVAAETASSTESAPGTTFHLVNRWIRRLRTQTPESAVEEELVGELALDFVRGKRLGRYLDAARELHLDDVADEDEELRLRLKDLRRLQVEWEVVSMAAERGVDLEATAHKASNLLTETAKFELDPAESDSACRSIPRVEKQVHCLHDYPALVNHRDVAGELARVAGAQLAHVRQMASGLRDRIERRRQYRIEMGEAIPDQRTLRLAQRYSTTLANSMTSRLQLLKELRALTSGNDDGGEDQQPFQLVGRDG